MTSQFPEFLQLLERQKVVGLWVLPLSLSLSLLHCLNSVLHQFVDSIHVDRQGWMKLSPLHQLLKALREANDTIGTMLASAQIDCSRWTARGEQHLDFPFNTVGFLPPYLPPVGDQRGDLTLDWQVCSVLQAALENEPIQGGSEEKKKRQN